MYCMSVNESTGMNPYCRIDIIKFELCIMDALFLREIYRAAFIILDTKAFSIFAFDDALNDRTRLNGRAYFSLTICQIV